MNPENASAVPLPRYMGQRNSGTGFGLPHRHFRVTDSTNSRARELAVAGAPHGTVVTADEQTEGRGRQGRPWSAPAGKALLYSAILRPLGDRPLLSLAAGLAVCEAAEELAGDLAGAGTEPTGPADLAGAATRAPGVECRVKWPNDVLLGSRKLAGILIEARPRDDWAVIGVGLNLTISVDEFPSELKATATSLFGSEMGNRGESRRSLPAVAPPGLPPVPFTAAVVLDRQLERWINADSTEILGSWSERDALRGREVSWEGGSGVADGVGDRGGLVVVSGGGRVVLDSGEVHLTVT